MKVRGIVLAAAILAAITLARADLVTGGYAIVTNDATASDPAWSEVIDSLAAKHDAAVFEFAATVFEVQTELAEFDPRWVCFVMKPEEIISYDAELFVRHASQITRSLDDDIYGDAIWAILTGYTPEDAMNIVLGPETLWVRNALLKTAGGWLRWFERGDYFSEGDTRCYWHKNPDGTIDTLVEPDDCTDTLVSLLNNNDVDIMVTSGHASPHSWQLHYPLPDGEGFFYSGGGSVWGDPVSGPDVYIETSNPKIYWGPGNCLIGKVADMDCMVLGWIHSGGAHLFCGYTVPTAYGYMGWGIREYFHKLQDRFTFPEAFFLNNQALLFDDEHDTPGINPIALDYDRDVVALYGDPKLEARVYPTVPPLYDQQLTCDTISPGIYHFVFSVELNENISGYDRPAFSFLPFEVNRVYVTIDSTNAHFITVTNDLVGMRFWYSGDDSLHAGERYYVAFTYRNITDTTVVVELKGWTHERRDIAGSSYYPWGSTVLTDSIAVQWTWDMPTSTSPSSRRRHVLTGDVNGDGQLEIVTVQCDTLFVLSAGGDVLVHEYVGIPGQDFSYVTMLEDVTGDSIPEIGIGYEIYAFGGTWGPWFSRIYSGTGALLKEFEKSGTRDGYMYPYTVVGQDVIICQNAGYALDPRGPSRWSYETATEIWQYDVGPCGRICSVADINGDGLLEIAWRSGTCHNGASGNGTTDDNCYTIITNAAGFNLLTQLYSGSTERDGSLHDMFLRFTEDGPYRIVSFKNYDPTYYHGTARIHIRATDGTILHTRTGLHNTAWHFAWADVDDDGAQEIVCSNGDSSTNVVLVLDSLLNVKDSLATPPGFTVRAICDVDGDGAKEILIASADSATVVCLNNHLGEKWRWRDTTGDQLLTVIVSDNDDDGKVEVIVLSESRLTVLEGTSGSAVDPNKKPKSFLLGICPNPFNSSLSVSYTVPEGSEFSVEVYDICGVRLAVLASGRQSAGSHTTKWTPQGNVPSGVYIVRLSVNGSAIAKRAVLVR